MDNENLSFSDMFTEERHPTPPPFPPATYSMLNGQELNLTLVSKHPLWGKFHFTKEQIDLINAPFFRSSGLSFFEEVGAVFGGKSLRRA